jgi:hypothetical protein
MWFLIRFGIRLVAFTGVFWFATRPRKSDRLDKDGKPEVKPARISIQPRRVIPLIGGLFGVLNTCLYLILRPLLNLATLGTFSVIMPLVVNGLLLWGTTRIVEKRHWIKIDGFLSAAWLVGAITIAHGVLFVALEYLPAQL